MVKKKNPSLSPKSPGACRLFLAVALVAALAGSGSAQGGRPELNLFQNGASEGTVIVAVGGGVFQVPLITSADTTNLVTDPEGEINRYRNDLHVT